MEQKLYSVIDVAKSLGVYPGTINYWYRWEDIVIGTEKYTELLEQGMPKLPNFKRLNDNPRGKKLWDESGIKQLKKFSDWVPKGRKGFLQEVTKLNNKKFYKNKEDKNK